ncbi:MAG: tetratricopeptide repeat protein [Deltaproteobacteria bacterium]|nr:tetratricopeptide repeat protein [Deltaproteobacteria bacterium]
MAKAGKYFAHKDTPDSLKRALDCYEKAISLLPDNHRLYMQKAVILRKLGRYQEALNTMQPLVGKYKDLTDVFIRSNMAKTYLAKGETKEALNILGDASNSHQAGAMMLVSEIHMAEGDMHKAQDTIERAVKRYPSTDWLLSKAAAFYWQKKEPEKAARLIAQGAKSLPEFSTWFFDDFLKVFATESQENILEAVRLLRDAGIGNWQIRALKARFAWHKRYDVALKIDDLVKEEQTMTRLENLFSSYNIVRQWKGAEEAKKWLLERVSDGVRQMAGMVIISTGEFDLMDDFVDPKRSAPKYREFLWLMRLIGWLGMDKQPAASVTLLEEHYRKQSQDYYFSIGQYLLGMKEESVLLGMLKDVKQRCEFAYYIGLKHRLEGEFRRSAEWYAICLETLQENNGEYHWAGDELFWWAKVGIERRHRLVRDDMALGRQEDQAKITGKVF